MHFNIVLAMIISLFDQSQSKAGVVNHMIHPCFRKRSTAGQLNVQSEQLKRKNNILLVT